MSEAMGYNDFIATVHERYALYGGKMKYADCFYERLSEQRPEIVERINGTGRKVLDRYGRAKFSTEVWSFIRDVW